MTPAGGSTDPVPVTPPGAPGTFTSENPARPSDVVGTFTSASAAHVASVVGAAAEAQRAWAARPASERATVIGGIAHALARELRALAAMVTREEGKPLAASENEVRKAVEQFHFASQLAYLVEGSTYPTESRGVLAYSLRSPVGVVVAVTPWNFPVSLPARKLAPALASGNAVIFKPSPATAATGDLLVTVCREAGLPPELLQVVHGHDPDAMAALLGDRRVDAVTFTGSDTVGATVRALTHPHARLQAELGGHNGVLVCADADLALAAREVAGGAFSLTGQACTASGRALVERPVYAAFCDLLAGETRRLTAGPGTSPGVGCGPVATRGQFDRLRALRSAAVADGRLLAEGELAGDADPDGYWVVPAAVTDLPADHPVLTGEVFGPILPVLAVESAGEAVERLNADRHGLVAAVHTTDLGTAHRFTQSVQCGIVKVNQRTTGNGIAPPFGGWKASRLGTLPEGGQQSVDFFTQTKTVYLRH
ncbi:MAG: aldehyde dehydrogenase family protein [Acidimicrobiales bacterium]